MQHPFQNGAAEPDRKPPIRFSRKNALWLFLIAAAGLILSGFAGGAITDKLPQLNDQARALLINALYYLPFCVLPVMISMRRKPQAAMSIRPNPVSIGAAIYISVLAVLCVFFVSDISLLWCIPLQKLGLNVFKNQIAVPADSAMLVLCVLTNAAIPGVCEELLFRGAVLSGFENEGSRRAAKASALLFALLHGSATGLPGQYVLGLILAQIVISADSIYAGMIFHTVYNAAVIAIEFLQREVPTELSQPADIFTAIGGFGGVLNLLLEILLIGWMLRFALNIFHMRGRLRGVQLISESRHRYAADEKVLLAAGVVLIAVLYASDIAYMLM